MLEYRHKMSIAKAKIGEKIDTAFKMKEESINEEDKDWFLRGMIFGLREGLKLIEWMEKEGEQ